MSGRSEGSGLAQVTTTREVAQYLKLHELTIRKYAAEVTILAIRIERVSRFDKDVIDRWIAERTNEGKTNEIAQRGSRQKKSGKKGSMERNG